jgi:hypothetical protein
VFQHEPCHSNSSNSKSFALVETILTGQDGHATTVNHTASACQQGSDAMQHNSQAQQRLVDLASLMVSTSKHNDPHAAQQATLFEFYAAAAAAAAGTRDGTTS